MSSQCQSASDKVKTFLNEPLKLEASHVRRELMDRTVTSLKSFTLHQLNYSSLEKEALALIWALQHFEVHVGSGSGSLTLRTDHKPSSLFAASSKSMVNVVQHIKG